MTISRLLCQLLDKPWISSTTTSQLSRMIRSKVAKIDGGTYAVGAPNSRYHLRLAPFALCTVAVTNQEFVMFLNKVRFPNNIDGTYVMINDIITENPVKRRIDGKYSVVTGYDSHPVVGVNWYGAALFCAAVGGRLPTEAEWEVAARAGDPDALYPWGMDQPIPSYANHSESVGTTTEVDAYPPNRWGFYDMSGNVRQWCADWYRKDVPYLLDRDTATLNYDSSVMKVVRGGAWNKGIGHLPCHSRAGKWPRMGSRSCGFRVAFGQRNLSSGEW